MTSNLLTVLQAAERLALKPGTVRKLISTGRLPCVRIGRAVRLREEDLEALARLGLRPQRKETRQ